MYNRHCNYFYYSIRTLYILYFIDYSTFMPKKFKVIFFKRTKNSFYNRLYTFTSMHKSVLLVHNNCTTAESYVHYLSLIIKNELISLCAAEVIKEREKVKYYCFV